MSASKRVQIIQQLQVGTANGKIEWKTVRDPRGETYVTGLPTGQAFQLMVRGSSSASIAGTIDLEVRDAEDRVTAEMSTDGPSMGAMACMLDAEGQNLRLLAEMVRKQTEGPLDGTLEDLKQLTGT